MKNLTKKFTFLLIETIKIVDGIPQNIQWHQRRFERSYYLQFLKPAKFLLNNLIDVPDEYKKGLVKLRFLYNENDCFCQYNFYKQKKIRNLKVIMDNTIEYSLKYLDRKKINNLFSKKQNADDILIVKNNRITDISFANIVFYDGKNWITPLYPLLKGTARERLLFEKKIIEKDILLNDLRSFYYFKIINAMLDFEKQEKINIDMIIV